MEELTGVPLYLSRDAVCTGHTDTTGTGQTTGNEVNVYSILRPAAQCAGVSSKLYTLSARVIILMFGERAVVVIVLKCIGWLRSSGNMPLSWIGIFLLTVLCSCYGVREEVL